MRLAKPHIDIGLFTNDIDAHREFWGDTIGLRLDHELTLEEGWVQHRYDAHDSVIKVNHMTKPLAERPRSGYVGLTIASTTHAPWQGVNPSGDFVRVVAPGTDGVVGIGITISTPDPDRMMEFYVRAMEFDEVAPHIAACGDSLLFVERGPGGSETDDFRYPAFRYLTVQIFDADEACREIVARGAGARLSLAPVSFADVARYAFVCDPDGNWVEISARTSLTGILPKTDS